MNLAQWQSDTDMKAALTEQKIAVVGLSANPARPSHDVARVMQNLGYIIVPINPREEHVLVLAAIQICPPRRRNRSFCFGKCV